MIVDCLEFRVFRDPDRIEMARDGLVKVDSSFSVSLLNGAFADAIGIVAGEDAILAVDNRGDNVAVLVDVTDTLLVDNLLCFG